MEALYPEEIFFDQGGITQPGIPPDSIADFSVVTQVEPYDIGYRIGVTVEEPSLLEPSLPEPVPIDYWGQYPRGPSVPGIPAIEVTVPQATESFPWWILALAAGALLLSQSRKTGKS